jgi:hypothetical protein
VIDCPVITFPCWSFTTADNVTVEPTTTENDEGDTLTVVTTGVGGGGGGGGGRGGGGGGGGGGAFTVTVDAPVFPEFAAEMTAVPAAIPVITPLALTVAVAVLFDDHATVWPAITFPLASFTVAESDVVAPTITEVVVGLTMTVMTTGCGCGVGSVVVPPLLEHTESRTRFDIASSARAERAAMVDMRDIGGSPGVANLCPELCLHRAKTKKPPRPRQVLSVRWRLGWHTDYP